MGVFASETSLQNRAQHLYEAEIFFFFFFSLMGPEFSSGKITPKKRNEGTRKRYTQNIPADKKPTLPTIIRGSQCRSHYDDPGKKRKRTDRAETQTRIHRRWRLRGLTFQSVLGAHALGSAEHISKAWDRSYCTL